METGLHYAPGRMKMKHLLLLMIASVASLLSGCVNISSNITLENPSVKPLLEGSQCTYVILGLFGAGTNSIEGAMRSTDPPIHTLRVARLNAWAYFPLPFSAVCIEVEGEPAPGAKKSVAPEQVNPMNQ